MKKNNKAAYILELLNATPEATNYAIAKRVGCTTSYVYKLRRGMVHVPPCSEEPVYSEAAPTQEVLEAGPVSSIAVISTILEERGSRYGVFAKHAFITQRLKTAMADMPNWSVLEDDMREALEMVAHKIGRILNGDPTYADSWVDIAGYAQLVADRLQGKER